MGDHEGRSLDPGDLEAGGTLVGADHVDRPVDDADFGERAFGRARLQAACKRVEQARPVGSSIRLEGDGDGPKLVFAHGLMGTGTVQRRFEAAVSRTVSRTSRYGAKL